MTTKIQSIAMFAVAAFALGGMAFAPAFAAEKTQNVDVIADDYDTTSDANGCGSGHELRTSLQAWHNLDSAKVWINATDCSSFEKVKVTLYVENNWIGEVTIYDDNHSVWFTPSIDAGDTVKAVATYYY